MKKNFGKLGAVCFFVIAASSLGCSSGSYRADRDEYNQYNASQAQRDAYRGEEGRRYQISPPPELVADGVVDPSGLHSTSTEGLRRTSDLVSPPPELTSAVYNKGYRADERPMQSETITTTTTATAAGAVADRSSSSAQIGKSAVLTFTAGESSLSDAEKAKLHEIVTTIGADNIRRVEVAAWSDKAFPRSGNDLPKGDRDLADRRADNINDYLKKEDDLSFMRIRTYSMAETSNWLARMFRTDEAELKSVFSRENDAPMAREDFNIILNEGGPSKAVVVFIRK